MQLMRRVFLAGLWLALTAQLDVLNRIVDGAVYAAESGSDGVQREIGGDPAGNDLADVEEYLRQREAERKRRQQRRKPRSAIGLNHRRVDLNRRLNYHKCRDLKRWDLKCY